MRANLYYDCYEAIINDILQDNGINSEKFFNKVGFSLYVRDKDESQIDIFYTNRDKLYEEDLLNYYNLELVPVDSEENTVVREIDNLIEKGKRIVGAVDTYYLPYCRSYKKEHYFHFLQIEKEDQVNYYIKDRYYGYQGVLNKEIVAGYMIKGREIGDFHFIYYDPRKIKYTEDFSKTEILKHNYKILINEKYYKNTSNSDMYIGVNAVLKTKEIILKAYENKDEDLIDKVTYGITKIMNSRRQFCNYLEVESLETLKNLYLDCYQKWQILQNFLLKLLFTQRFTKVTLNNILRSISEVEKIELTCMHSLLDYK